MREIKFRAWNKKYKFMDTAWLLDFEHGLVAHREHDQSDMSDCFLMQFTGLHDKNGVEIYEGDILHVTEYSGHEICEYKSPVKFIESGFLVTEPNGTQVPLACFHNEEGFENPLFDIKVIGNIYENPDLLGGDN